eukprot:1461103-Karenia_brevis.AAC.1
MKKALTGINSSTPYQALFGHQPALLPPIEGGTAGQLQDERSSEATLSRHYARPGNCNTEHHCGERRDESSASSQAQ